MSRFDDELRNALRRTDPPDGFAERVMARVAEERSKPGWPERFMRWVAAPRMRWAAVAAMCLVMLAGIQYQREAARRARGEEAKKQVLLALRITAEQMQIVQRGIHKVGASW